jgi:hypothetical protein
MPIGEVEVAWFRRPATMIADLAEYDIVPVSATMWELRRHGLEDAVARFGRDRLLSARHEITWEDGHLVVHPRFLRSRFVLLDGDDEVGRARPAHFLSNGLIVEVPERLPAYVAGLVVWTVVRMRRVAAAAASGGG